MRQYETISNETYGPLQILLVDDDEDDRELFASVLRSLPIPTQLTTIEDCKGLMAYLFKLEKLPDVLFLDFNMPRLNGVECLSDIQKDERLKKLPIIIYSMFIAENVVEFVYNKGVHYYVQKGNLLKLKNDLHHILKLLIENNFTQPTREKFTLTLAAA